MTDVVVPQYRSTLLGLISCLIVHILPGSANAVWEIVRVAKRPIYHYFHWARGGGYHQAGMGSGWLVILGQAQDSRGW